MPFLPDEYKWRDIAGSHFNFNIETCCIEYGMTGVLPGGVAYLILSIWQVLITGWNKDKFGKIFEFPNFVPYSNYMK